MKLLLLLALLVGAQAQCLSTDNACLAFEWAFPLWTTANARWNQAAGWAPAPLYPAGFLSGTPSLFFKMNSLSIRRASLPPPAIPPMALCDAFLCEGTPHILNPGPIITPNVDTTYGAAWLDLAQPQVLIIPNAAALDGPRYYSITFFDMYLNTKTTLSNINYPAGGVWCIVTVPQQVAACTAAIPQLQQKIPGFTAYTDTLTLPKYGVAIARIYSSGAPDIVNLNACGPDGCTFASNIAFSNLTNAPPTIDPYSLYASMASPAGCPYVYGQKPCGNAATPAQRNKFWDTVCQVLHDGPPSSPAEQAYIQTMFSGFGITPTGCSNVNYGALNAAFDAGYASLLAAQSTFGVASNNWLYFPTTGTWDASTFHTRAVSSFRLHFLVDNSQAGYWAAFTTADGRKGLAERGAKENVVGDFRVD